MLPVLKPSGKHINQYAKCVILVYKQKKVHSKNDKSANIHVISLR